MAIDGTTTVIQQVGFYSDVKVTCFSISGRVKHGAYFGYTNVSQAGKRDTPKDNDRPKGVLSEICYFRPIN